MQSGAVQRVTNSRHIKKSKWILKEIIRSKALFLLMLPGMLVLLVNNYIPMIGTIIAFKELNLVKGLFGSPWNHFKNFEFLFKSPDLPIIIRNTLCYNAVFIVLTPVFAITLAVVLNELRNNVLAKFYQSFMFLPNFLSWVVVGYLGYAFMGPESGFINISILQPLGLHTVDWYADARFWPFVLPLGYLWKHIGYNCVIYLAAISSIDTQYYEAAIIDGATKRQQITGITVPMLRPMVTVLTILAVGSMFRSEFGLFYQLPMNSGLLNNVTNVVDTYVYRALLLSNDYTMSSAAGLLQSVFGFILVLGANLAVKKINEEDSLF